MDNNFWFYTLSAIPQTLAAMFALLIAVLVYRLEMIDKIIERDISQSKDFILVIFGDEQLEIHDIEGMDSEEYSKVIKVAVHSKLKNPSSLRNNKKVYDRLRDLYNLKISEYHRYYSSDEVRIFNYLLQKSDSIDLNIRSKKVIKYSFAISAVATSFMIALSLYFLPLYKINCYSFDTVLFIRDLALINILIITLSVFIMTFTKFFIQNYAKQKENFTK